MGPWASLFFFFFATFSRPLSLLGLRWRAGPSSPDLRAPRGSSSTEAAAANRSRGRHCTVPTRRDPAQSQLAQRSLSLLAASKEGAAAMRVRCGRVAQGRREAGGRRVGHRLRELCSGSVALAFHLWSCSSSVAFLSGQVSHSQLGSLRFS